MKLKTLVQAKFWLKYLPAYNKGTSINDVRRFSAIFYLPTYHVQQFLPYNVRYLGFFGPPTYPKIGRHLWTFPKGGFKSEDTVKFLSLQHKYSKSWAENLNKLFRREIQIFCSG